LGFQPTGVGQAPQYQQSLFCGYAPACGSEEGFALQLTHPYGFACARLRVGYLRLAPPALSIAQIPNIIANLESVAMAEVLKSQGGFILFSARSRGQVLKMASIQGDVVARTRLDASWDNIRPFLFFAKPSCNALL
jgi:hypothetical protein